MIAPCCQGEYRMLRQLIAVSLLCFALSGCLFHPYEEQGTILSLKKVDQIKRGMSATTVRNLLGTPVLENVYYNGKMIYVYTVEPPHEDMQREKLVIYFVNSRVQRIKSTVGAVLLPPFPAD